jgi:hypothetical protein
MKDAATCSQPSQERGRARRRTCLWHRRQVFRDYRIARKGVGVSPTSGSRSNVRVDAWLLRGPYRAYRRLRQDITSDSGAGQRMRGTHGW